LKLSREIKTAILVIAAIALFIWGYGFLKGKDLFTNYKTLFVEYKNVEGLVIAAPVTINGLSIGKVNAITLNNQTGNILVEMQINTDFPISKSSIAEIYAPSALGGKQLAIISNIEDKNLAVDGDFLKPAIKLGLTDAIAEQLEPLKDKITKLLDNANIMLESVNDILDEKSKADLKNSLASLSETMNEFKRASGTLNSILDDNKKQIGGIVTDFKKVSSDFTSISDGLNKADLGKTAENLQKTLISVDKIIVDLESGKGTIGKMLKDEAFYNNLSKTSKELELLLQDLRLNPTRYVNVSLFGKKNKPYVAPVNDSIKK
jgi:phospholipid/cholesterol/gamma-HCH transport system substrate-binding protein